MMSTMPMFDGCPRMPAETPTMPETSDTVPVRQDFRLIHRLRVRWAEADVGAGE